MRNIHSYLNSKKTIEKKTKEIKERFNEITARVGIILLSVFIVITGFGNIFGLGDFSYMIGLLTVIPLIFIRLIGNKKFQNIGKQFFKIYGSKNQSIILSGLPNVICSNEDKRKWFIGKEYDAISSEVNWYKGLNSTKKSVWIIIKIIFASIGSLIANSIINESSILISILVGGSSGLILLGTLLSFGKLLHIEYISFKNSLKQRKIIRLSGSIEPTTQSDIGKLSFLSAKIEKLWI